LTELDPWLRCALAVLATWRVTHLFAAEDGPGNVLARLRHVFESTWAGKLMDCFYCLSLWIAAPFAFWITARPCDIVGAWLALSGAACLLERAAGAPVVIRPLRGDSDGMLWQEPREHTERQSLRDPAGA
jgi:hypothetical protein